MINSVRGRILVSHCLLGAKVRYDGGGNLVTDPYLDQWQKEGRLVFICPEVAGGLSTPRAPAEIQFGSGEDVIAGNARVIDSNGVDVSSAFIAGANAALTLAKTNNCQYALLARRSPSCGNEEIYDGHFIGQLVGGQGTTATLLSQHGIQVFNQSEIKKLAELIESES